MERGKNLKFGDNITKMLFYFIKFLYSKWLPINKMAAVHFPFSFLSIHPKIVVLADFCLVAEPLLSDGLSDYIRFGTVGKLRIFYYLIEALRN